MIGIFLVVFRSYSVATPRDLFKEFDAVSSESGLPAGVTMTNVLQTWTEEAGYPLVTIKSTDDKTATVTQVDAHELSLLSIFVVF